MQERKWRRLGCNDFAIGMGCFLRIEFMETVAEIVKGSDTSISEKLVSNWAPASSVDGRLIQTSPGSVLRTG